MHEPNCQRKFCGYCGTHLSYWTEGPEEEKDFLHITIGSLRGRDIAVLEELDLLPEDVTAGDVEGETLMLQGDDATMAESQGDGAIRTTRQGTAGSLTWFEEMIDGSRLGRATKTRRGAGASADGTTTIQWEVTQYGHEDDDTSAASHSASSSSKRKLGEVVSEDSNMKG